MEELARPVFSASISLLAGYTFLWLAYFRRFSIDHLRSDRFPWYLLGWAFVFFLIGEVSANLIPAWSISHLQGAWTGIQTAGVTAPGINAIIFAVLAAALENVRVWWVMRNDVSVFIRNQPRPVSRWHIRRRMRFAASAMYIDKSSNAALQTWYRASVLGKPVLITLKSHKIYVGAVYASIDEPSRDFTFVKILPTRSGYRDPTTKKVTFSTDYGALLEKAADPPSGSGGEKGVSRLLQSDLAQLEATEDAQSELIDLNDLGIVISWKDIESLTIYDEMIYQAFQAQKPKESGPEFATSAQQT